MKAGIEAMRASGAEGDFAEMDPDDLPFACDDELVTTAIEAQDFLTNKMEALRAHGTQVAVDGGFFALADNVGAEAFGTEYYRLVKGRRGPAGPDAAERENDLFAGITE
jgi:N-acetyl-1-D-myo-inositol-2-amino-2-deoxy-alpha-D-glucopyranoside deacetylase